MHALQDLLCALTSASIRKVNVPLPVSLPAVSGLVWPINKDLLFVMEHIKWSVVPLYNVAVFITPYSSSAQTEDAL